VSTRDPTFECQVENLGRQKGRNRCPLPQSSDLVVSTTGFRLQLLLGMTPRLLRRGTTLADTGSMRVLLRALLLLTSAAAACTHQVTPALVNDSNWVQQPAPGAPLASSPGANEPPSAPAPHQEPTDPKHAAPATQPARTPDAADASREPGKSKEVTVPRTPNEIPGAMPAPDPL
jgi:hypothetical protein